MSSGPGHIELARSLDSIHIGRRHRKDLGNIDALAASIDQDDLLQLITIDPEGEMFTFAHRYGVRLVARLPDRRGAHTKWQPHQHVGRPRRRTVTSVRRCPGAKTAVTQLTNQRRHMQL